MSRSTRSSQPKKEANPVKGKDDKKITDAHTNDDEEEKNDGKKQTLEYVWETYKTIGYGRPKNYKIDQKKVAGFDMDFTVIRTKSGKTFPVNEHDWLLWDKAVKPKLQQLHKDGFSVVIFSNQGGIGKNHTTHKQVTTKMTNIANEVGVPIICLYASEDDEYKKPNKGMWDFYLNRLASHPDYDKKESFYCGDAAGRKGPPKDFTDTDLKFGLNIGIKFYTPEQLFLEKEEQIDTDFFNPKTLPTTGQLFKEKNFDLKSNVQEMIILMGSPGSGKSTFVHTHLKDYVRVNRDTLKTIPKCLAAAQTAISAKKNVVIDNTNPTVEARAEFIALAKKNKIQVRGLSLELSKDLAFHLNNQRESNKHRQHFSERVSKIPIHTYFKNYQAPTKAEGFDAVATVNFIAGPFQNEQDEQSFYSFTK